MVDYKAMQNSPAAMQLKERVLPPELKRLETALKSSGLKVNEDADMLAFAAFRAEGTTERTDRHGGGTRLVGMAQGQFQTAEIMANFAKNKTKPVMVRNNSVYPMGSTGHERGLSEPDDDDLWRQGCGEGSAGCARRPAPNFLKNSDMMNDMSLVDGLAPVWSLLDQKGTQTMMKSVLGEAAQLADYDTVKNRLKSARYTMDFSNGVKFDMSVVTSDSITAATAATLMKAAILLKKTTGSPMEKTAMDNTTIDSNSGTLIVEFSSSDSEFASLMRARFPVGRKVSEVVRDKEAALRAASFV